MPFKRNPINSEKINSLCRLVSTHVDLFWQNAATTVLERSLDDSANRRIAIPEIFLAVDEILVTAIRTVGRMTVHEEAVGRNLNGMASLRQASDSSWSSAAAERTVRRCTN